MWLGESFKPACPVGWRLESSEELLETLISQSMKGQKRLKMRAFVALYNYGGAHTSCWSGPLVFDVLISLG